MGSDSLKVLKPVKKGTKSSKFLGSWVLKVYSYLTVKFLSLTSERLNNFSKELEALKEKDELSNLELEIAQAKYKQLLAQIALEEAQNAK